MITKKRVPNCLKCHGPIEQKQRLREDYFNFCYNCFRNHARKSWKKHYGMVKKDYLRWKAYVFKANRGWASALTKEILQTILEQQKNACLVCGDSLINAAWEIDHVVPFAKGGTHKPNNLQIVCRFCNRGKWDYPLAEYIAHCHKVSRHNALVRTT